MMLSSMKTNLIQMKKERGKNMAVYLKSGEGRCPSPSSYTKDIYFSKSDLDEIRTVYGAHADFVQEVIEKVIDIMENPLLDKILEIAEFAGLSKEKICAYITDYLTGNVRDIVTNVKNTTGGAVFECKIGCVNKGKNGHYWVIRSFSI